MFPGSNERAQLAADVVHVQTVANQTVIPEHATGEIARADQLHLPRTMECAKHHLPHGSYVLSSLNGSGSDFDEDTLPRRSNLLSGEHALSAHTDRGRNIYRIPL